MPARPRRILTRTTTTLSLLLSLASALLWWNADPDTAAAWTQGRRAAFATARDNTLRLTLAGPFPDPARARRAAHLLESRRRIETRIGLDAINARLMAERRAAVPAAQKRREAAAASGDPDALRVLDLDAEETVLKWENFLGSWVGALVTDRPSRTTRFAGVTLDRGSCRLPVYDDDKGQATFEPPVPVTTLTLPCYLPVLLFALAPAFVLTRAVRRSATLRHRLQNHLCPACGYDLRASPHHCPECGHTPAERTP